MVYADPTVITDKEREALKQFKEKIPDILATFSEYSRHDVSLLRWLRARELDLSKSEEMLRKSMALRAKEEVDSIFEWKSPDYVDQNLHLKISGFDKDGCLVVTVPFGHWDLRKTVSMGFKLDFLRHTVRIFETVLKFSEFKSKNEGSMITQVVVVLDFEGFTLRQITSKETVETILEFIRRFEANYPEILKAAWVVNAPKIFEILYALVKPLLTPRTVAKVNVHGSNSDQWRSLLLGNIEPDQLPSNYGGSNTCCKDYKVADGFDVFPVNEVFSDSEFIPVVVDAGGKHVVKFILAKGSKLSWNFRTTDYDIGFSLQSLYSSDKPSDVPVVESETAKDADILIQCARADSHIHLQKGTYIADISGAYFVVFDNSFSRFRKKSLSYCIRSSSATK